MPQTYELTLHDYWSIFLKRRWIIAVSFSSVFATAILYTNLQPTYYKAAAIVKIEPVVGLSRVFSEESYYNYMHPYELSDYEKQAVSLPIVEKAVLALKEEGRFGEIPPQGEKLDNLISVTAGNLSAETIKETNMIKIEMVSEDPQMAATILNKVVEVFKFENIKLKGQQVRNVREFIETQLERVSSQLRGSEDRIKALTLKGVGGVVTSIMGKISELESTRDNLLIKFTKAHPDVVKVNEQIETLKELLKHLPKEEFEFNNLKRDLAVNEKLYNSLREKLQEMQIKESERFDHIVVVNPAIAPRAPFSPNKPGNAVIGVVLGMLFGISAALIIEHLDTSIGKIEDLESVTKCSVIGVIPYTAVKDKEMKEILRKRKHGIASLLAAHARKGEKADGEVFCRRRFSFRRRVRREDMMERLRSQLVTSYNEGSDFLESFRLLGANVQLAFGEGGRIRRKCILVTSSKAQEGKSLTASNLSIVMAQMGYKTVLIDADLRRAVVHLFFGLKDRRGGLSDVLTGEITLEKAVRTTTDLFLGEMRQEDLLKHPWMDNLHVITAGTAFPNLTYLLNTEKLEAFLQMLRDRYEVILMDSSPVLSVSDTSIIIPKTDGVLLVYRTGVTSRIALRRARRQIESVKGKEMLRGIVLNFVTPDIGSDYYYYYRRGEHYDTERHG